MGVCVCECIDGVESWWAWYLSTIQSPYENKVFLRTTYQVVFGSKIEICNMIICVYTCYMQVLDSVVV